MKKDQWSIEVVNTAFKIYLCVEKKENFSAFLKATRAQDAIASIFHR